jgi:anti-sigma factor RsiW
VTCDLARTTVHGYFDGELDAVRAAEFERHIEYCSECTASLARIRALREQLQTSGLYEQASPQFRRKMLDRLEPVPSQPRKILWPWLIPAAAVCAAAVVVWAALFFAPSRTASTMIAAELVDAHVRSLQPGHLMDVTSSDQHTVKPWFDGKLDFIPPVTDHAAEGFALLGGRLDVLNGRTAAALVYGRRKHFINLFVWPTREAEMVRENSGTRQGYNYLLWRSGDLSFCLISDAAPADLKELRQLLSH